MSPEDSSVRATPPRPRFSWDTRKVPWTRGDEDPLEYVKAVLAWGVFHDNLFKNSGFWIRKKNRGIVLISELFESAKDVCHAVRDEVLASNDSLKPAVETVYKRDPLSVIAHIFEELQKLVFNQGAKYKSVWCYELRFNAQICKYNSLWEAVQFWNAMAAFYAFYVLANANVDSSQRLSIRAVAYPSDTMLSLRSSIKKFFKTVKYETVATVLRQREERLPARTSLVSAVSEAAPLTAQKRLSNRRRKMTRKEIHTAETTTVCLRCGMYRRWMSDRMPDGQLPSKTYFSFTVINPAWFQLLDQKGYLGSQFKLDTLTTGFSSVQHGACSTQIRCTRLISSSDHNVDECFNCGPPLDKEVLYSAIG